MTDRNEALRLADFCDGNVLYRPAADLLRQQAERIAELESAHAIAIEIGAQYAAERDTLRAEVETLKVALRMGAEAEVARAHEVVGLREEVERLRADAERYQWLRLEHQRHDPICHLSWKRNGDRSSSEWVNTADLDTAIDHARTTHKDEG